MTSTPQTAPCLSPPVITAILHELSETLLPHPGLNERYVHHAFSHCLQTVTPCLDLATPHETLLLHPEWPTYKNATSIAYARSATRSFPTASRIPARQE